MSRTSTRSPQKRVSNSCGCVWNKEKGTYDPKCGWHDAPLGWISTARSDMASKNMERKAMRKMRDNQPTPPPSVSEGDVERLVRDQIADAINAPTPEAEEVAIGKLISKIERLQEVIQQFKLDRQPEFEEKP